MLFAIVFGAKAAKSEKRHNQSNYSKPATVTDVISVQLINFSSGTRDS